MYLTKLQLKAAGLFKYAWSLVGNLFLEGKDKNLRTCYLYLQHILNRRQFSGTIKVCETASY